jgi:signal transduction histidine kinase
MSRFKSHTFIAYLCAAIGVALATAIRFALHPVLGEHLIFSMYYLAVSFAAWAGGLSPALVTALSSSVLATYLFSETGGSLQLNSFESLCALILFLVVSLVIGILSEISLRSQARAREAEQQKDDFFAILAHELRNPLAIIHYTNLAEDHSRREGQPARSEIIDRQVQQLDQMIEDLLDISQVSRGKFRLKPDLIDVSALVEDGLEKAAAVIEARGHELTIERSTGDLMLWGDPVRLQQVITNLLTNAARYTPKGGKIEFQVWRDKDHVAFRVRDNGLGIPKEMLSRIFDLQTQVARSLDSSGASLGVGLALVRTLVELHGGTVSATSEGPNRGSEFIVRLPLHKPDPSAAPRSSVSANRVKPTATQKLDGDTLATNN